MASQLFSASAATIFLILISIYILRFLSIRTSQTRIVAKKPDHLDVADDLPKPTKLGEDLASALPNNVILPSEVAAFKQSMNSYWAKQECEVIPACIVRPRDVQQLSTAVTILKREYDERKKQGVEGKADGLFAVRSGGHSPLGGAASIKGGILIDLSLFCEVIPSEDGSSVVIGAGAKWMNVSKVLDAKGLAVVGGRNSAVGVGGLTLGGGLSFFTPRFGFVCDNVLNYEIVLASGSIATASASSNPDLWRALKGGSNNFGIITRITARSFPSTQIWSGFLYMPVFQATKVLAAFHEYVQSAGSSSNNSTTTTYDHYAAGPIACFSYIQALGIQAISVNLAYTKRPENEKKWPTCWRTSPFASLWRFWSTCQVRTLTSATDEMNALNPPGRRQIFANMTIKNDPATLTAVHAAYQDAIAPLRRARVKGLVWTLVLQPLFLPDGGDANPLGLYADDGTPFEPLVIVSFTVNWDERSNDELVRTMTRRAIEQMEAVAAANKTGHPYRYLNYCAAWQRPFKSYGEENWRFLQRVSRKYDPDGLFQRSCVGGFKLDVDHGS